MQPMRAERTQRDSEKTEEGGETKGGRGIHCSFRFQIEIVGARCAFVFNLKS
jgi:hypothetical protein